MLRFRPRKEEHILLLAELRYAYMQGKDGDALVDIEEYIRILPAQRDMVSTPTFFGSLLVRDCDGYNQLLKELLMCGI